VALQRAARSGIRDKGWWTVMAGSFGRGGSMAPAS
jgi:hypothetical protein